ncbi:MAG: leucyl aminopeptidase, partial [Lachnospiraceae bacterium]|nr:leucyl aminopeptidase [Lachnospiraceae bacterium]
MITERYQLSIGRIREIQTEQIVCEPFRTYFAKVAKFIELLDVTYRIVESGKLRRMDLGELQDMNRSLYADVLPENYEKSYANPTYAVSVLTKAGYDASYGQILS